jgi:hypothetical protein
VDAIKALLLKPQVLEAIAAGVRDAPFLIRESSALALMRIIDGGFRLIAKLASPPVIETLIRLLENERWRSEAIERIWLIIWRCRLAECDDRIRELIHKWDRLQAIRSVADDEEATEETKARADEVMRMLEGGQSI